MARGKRDDMDPVRSGRDGVDEPVEVRRLAGGDAVLIPRALRGLTGERLELVSEVQHVAVEISRLQDRVDELVPELRAAGVSWNGIGWCLGMAAQSAQERWGRPRV